MNIPDFANDLLQKVLEKKKNLTLDFLKDKYEEIFSKKETTDFEEGEEEHHNWVCAQIYNNYLNTKQADAEPNMKIIPIGANGPQGKKANPNDLWAKLICVKIIEGKSIIPISIYLNKERLEILNDVTYGFVYDIAGSESTDDETFYFINSKLMNGQDSGYSIKDILTLLEVPKVKIENVAKKVSRKKGMYADDLDFRWIKGTLARKYGIDNDNGTTWIKYYITGGFSSNPKYDTEGNLISNELEVTCPQSFDTHEEGDYIQAFGSIVRIPENTGADGTIYPEGIRMQGHNIWSA